MSNEEASGAEFSSRDAPGSEQRRHRPDGITPEQRRLLDTPRAPSEHPTESAQSEADTTPAPDPKNRPTLTPSAESHLTHKSRRVGSGDFGGVTATGPPPGRASRVIEARQAFLILGTILLLGLSFYGGTKLNYVKYLLASRNAPKLEQGADRYPGVAADELVKQALNAERAGKWQEAVERFMAAKNKDLRYRGILFRVGKVVYEHRDFDAADKAFERAITFGENVEAANFYRGLIAVRRRNLPAAEQFFEAAVEAAPFVPDYHYYWGETLRLDLKPEQIKYVGISHYHGDHIGQVGSFPKATLPIGKGDWDVLTSPKPPENANPAPFANWIKGESKVDPVPLDKKRALKRKAAARKRKSAADGKRASRPRRA